MLCCYSAAIGAEPTVFWVDGSEPTSTDERRIVPASYRNVRIDLGMFRLELATVPHENNVPLHESEYKIAIPLPDGTDQEFRIVEAPVMAPELAAKFPSIKTYTGQGIDDPTATLRFDVTPRGFHGAVISEGDSYYIDPYSPNDLQRYISYWKTEYEKNNVPVFEEIPPIRRNESVDSKFDDVIRRKEATKEVLRKRDVVAQKTSSGTELRTYRLALAVTGEYTTFHGGTVAGAVAAMNTTVNRINGVYEREVAIRMVLVADNDLLVYTNAAEDPYTNDDGGTLLSENQTNIDAVIGAANYDIGHIFSTAGGGVAVLGSVVAATKRMVSRDAARPSATLSTSISLPMKWATNLGRTTRSTIRAGEIDTAVGRTSQVVAPRLWRMGVYAHLIFRVRATVIFITRVTTRSSLSP